MTTTTDNERGENMAREIPELRHWMTATDVAHELGRTRQTVNKMIRDGDLKTAHRLGSRLYVVKRSEVDALKASKAEALSTLQVDNGQDEE